MKNVTVHLKQATLLTNGVVAEKGTGGNCPPIFWAVGKLWKNSLVRNLLSKSEKLEAENTILLNLGQS